MCNSEHYFQMRYQAKVLTLDRIKPCLDRDPPISVKQTQEMLMKVYNRNPTTRLLCKWERSMLFVIRTILHLDRSWRCSLA